MSIRIGINGYGRIGQSVLRAIYSSPYRSEFTIAAINELADIETLTYLTRYDTTHGRFPYPLTHDNNTLYIGDDSIKILREEDPRRLDWGEQNIDLLFECSGAFETTEKAAAHLSSGAKKILLSYPTTTSIDATIVFGYNHATLSADHQIVSSASCTTNCIVPILHILNEEFSIVNGVTTTLHSAMNDQPIIDSYHRTNLRLTRSALQSIIPVDTSLSKGINRLMPHLNDKFECLHLRVPTINVSVMDLSLQVQSPTNRDQVNDLLAGKAKGELSGLVGFTEEPHASVDFNGDPRSSIIDGSQTRVSGDTLIKMLCWFDNEWGYASRMLDVAHHWMSL